MVIPLLPGVVGNRMADAIQSDLSDPFYAFGYTKDKTYCKKHNDFEKKFQHDLSYVSAKIPGEKGNVVS